jgi:glycosyltransferase involved in cell wall biosynthesis
MPAPRKILVLHNRYLWRGGEDETFDAEVALLREHGHEVVERVADNREIVARGRLAALLGLWRGAWSRPAYREMSGLVRREKPDLVHVHNFWYALSPSVLTACHDAGIPVVLRLPNFRLLCPGGVLLDRTGRSCQDCVGQGPGRGVRRRCYHGSLLASWAVARMIRVSRRRGTWERDVDLYLVPSEFCKEVFVRGGLPAGKIAVKPNFVAEPFGLETTDAHRCTQIGAGEGSCSVGSAPSGTGPTPSEPLPPEASASSAASVSAEATPDKLPRSPSEEGGVRYDRTGRMAPGGNSSDSSEPSVLGAAAEERFQPPVSPPIRVHLCSSVANSTRWTSGSSVSSVVKSGVVKLGAPLRALFIGRLSREKGLVTLLKAWREVAAATGAELRLVGDGPLRAELEALAAGLPVSFAGRVEGPALFEEIRAAALTVLPSECYETFGRVVVESYACGRPVVVSNLGGPAELVRDEEKAEGDGLQPFDSFRSLRAVSMVERATGDRLQTEAEGRRLKAEGCRLQATDYRLQPNSESRSGAAATGLLFEPGNAGDLAEKLLRLLADQPLRERMGAAARAEYLAKYTPEENYRLLMSCYERAGGSRRLEAEG